MSDKLEFLSFSTSLCKGTEVYFLKCINLHVVVPNSFSLLREHDMGSQKIKTTLNNRGCYITSSIN